MNEVIDIISIFTVGFIIQFLIIIILNLLKKAKIFKNLKYIAISSYVVVIINLTLWPPVMGQPTINWSEISYNLVPFDSIIGSLNHSYSMIGIRNVCGNFILLLPLAMLVEFKNWKGSVKNSV